MVIATQAARPLTVEDLVDFPDDGNRREIVQGELVVTPAPTPAHQLVVGELFALIRAFVRERGLGRVLPSPVDIRLSVNDIVEPDIVFVPADRETLLQGKFIDGPPELVVEVLSPPSKQMDLNRKRTLYALSGISEYWIVDPEAQSVLIHQLQGASYVLVPAEAGKPRSLVLEGLQIDVVELFKGIPR